MFGNACVGTVCGFAGQIHPVSANANNIWSNSGCASQDSMSGTLRTDIPITYPESMGWMLCDGRSLSCSAYPELFAVLGYLYGGEAESFRLPDYRGLFLRGVDAGSGMDPNASKRIGPTGSGTNNGIGSYQCDALQAHTHTYKAVVLAAPAQSGNAAGQATGDVQTAEPTSPARTAPETRPKNIAINYLIKFR